MEKTAKQVGHKMMEVTSEAFENHGVIPNKYTCDGENISPPLEIHQIPAQAKSLAIIVDDPDAPAGTWVHWLMWNLPVTSHLKENEAKGIQGINDFKHRQYGGPCPPDGTHRYFFKVYALDTQLDLSPNAHKEQLEKSMNGHIIGFGQLIGMYKRNLHQSA
jgi:Raf kinase inhibitor-like YbhB/YbcL family protein